MANGPERDALVSGLCQALVSQNPEQSAHLAFSLSNSNAQIEAIQAAMDM
jgi:hypothetical protein